MPETRLRPLLEDTDRILRLIFDRVPGAVFVLRIEGDRRYRCVSFNRGAMDLTGFTQDQLMNHFPEEVMGPEFGGRITSACQQAIRSGEPQSFEQLLEVPRGRRNFEVTLTAVCDPDRECRYVLGTAIDVTERVRTQAQARALVQRQQALLNSIHDYAWMKDREGCFVAVNEALARSLNTTPEEMIGKRGSDYWSGDFEETFLKNDAAVMRTGEAMRCVEISYDDRGNRVWRDSIKVPTFDGEGNVTGTAGTSRDTTELQHAFEALKESEFRLREAARIARLGYWELDLDTMKFRPSPDFYESIRLPSGALGSTFWDLLEYVHLDDRAKVKEAVERARTHREGWDLELRMVRSNGELRFYHSVSRVFEDEHGKATRVFGISRDVTRRREYEQTLTKSREDLKRLSGQLLRLQEQERKKIAQEIHDEFGQALSALKMDLFWIKGRLREDQVELKEKLERMSGLIGDSIRAMRRTVTELRPALLDDMGLAEALRWQLRQFAERSSSEVSLRISPEEPKLDPNLGAPLFRIAQEALTNIVRHAEATKVEVELTVESSKLLLRIADNGRGFGVDAKEKGTHGLLGMRERAEMIGGSLEIYTAPGDGTDIRVSLQGSDRV